MRDREKERERIFYPLVHSPTGNEQRVGAGPGQSQELEAPFGSPTWVAGPLFAVS